jgi:hypothetical protein
MEVLKDPKIRASLELLNAYAKEKADDIGDVVSRNYTHLRDAVSKGTGTAVRNHPGAMIGAAAIVLVGLGVLIGSLVGQNKK